MLYNQSIMRCSLYIYIKGVIYNNDDILHLIKNLGTFLQCIAMMITDLFIIQDHVYAIEKLTFTFNSQNENLNK